MVADEKIRKEIKDRVEKVPSDKLNSLLAFVKLLEDEGHNDEGLLSFFGILQGVDEELMADLTIHLPERRLESDR
ncbi:MAG: hypothetical protein H6559_00225 [Lewinellaceae bacterium]|nr:hypothetical protein [Lewinellaceae bacterium]